MQATIKRLFRSLRRWYFTRKVVVTAAAVGKDLKVNGQSRVTPTTYLGNNVNFNGMEISGYGRVTIGDNFHSGTECMMITSIHNYDRGVTIPYDNTFINRDIAIEDNVWLGSRVIVLGGVRIGEGAIVQAGSVVVSDIPPCAIAGGHPAKVFKTRNIEHYEALKREKRFF